MSERERAPYERESQEHFRLLVESVLDYGIFMLDPQGYVASWNSGAERIKGWRADEIIGRHFYVFYPQEAIDKGWPAHELTVATREGRFEDEGWRLRKDGTPFWANVVITAVRDHTGQLRGFAKVTRDLTARKRIEELEAAERRINEFLAMLGHELRNPLAPIRNAVAILRAGSSSGAPPDYEREERAASIIERQVVHLTRLVDDLLDVSRITSGKIGLRTESVDLAASVHSAIEAARPAMERKRQAFEFQHVAWPLPVRGDPTRLTQIIVNLLDNASKYTPAGGHILLAVERLEKLAVIRVRDDGLGIPTELLPRMFDLFVQGERGLDRSQGGLGLGLTLVRRLVDLHGGTVTAASQGPGRGSEFEVRIPLDAGAAHKVSAAGMAAAETAPSRILVVDDNEDSAESMATLVGMWGHDVRTANDAAGALRAAAEHRPEVVLLDIGMPQVSGYEVAQQLRAMPGFERTVLIAMTGYGQEEDRRRTKEAGFNHHLTKPVQPETLKAILSSVLEE
jgi:PAS domain S-box-containing protein